MKKVAFYSKIIYTTCEKTFKILNGKFWNKYLGDDLRKQYLIHDELLFFIEKRTAQN
jgi:hypothetical protein